MDLRRNGMPSNLESRLVRLLAREQQFTVDYEPKPTGVYDWEDDWQILIKKAETFESRELQKILVNREQLRMLEKLLNDAYTIRRPKPSEYENRKQVIRVLNDIAKDLYGYSASSPVVEEFGSFSMDLFTAESDLDLSINFPNIPFVFPRELKIKTLRKFAKKLYSLQSAGRVQKVETVMGAKVPILKFVDTATGVECDVSVENMDGIAKSLIIRHICSIDERFQKLSLLMKEWAKAHDINSPKDQTLSSLSIILLVAFHLQTRDPPILPPFSAILKDGDDPAQVKNSVRNFQNYGRRNTETLGELFVSFLIKLTSVEDLWSKGLCASSYLGHWTSKTWNLRIAVMSVEDFYDRAQNVARAVGKIEAKTIHSSIHLTIQNVRRFMNFNIEELKLEESLFGSVYGTHHLFEPNSILRKENYEKKVYNPNGVMDLRAAPSPSTRPLPTGIWGVGNGAAFMNGWSQETQPATDSWGSRCQQLPYEFERRKKEEMERSAKLNEIAERQRKREEELEERGRLIAAVEFERRKKEEMERSARLNEIAERQRKREEEPEERGRLIAAVESERRKKEEMERSAKLNEIAERQRKREEELEERGRLIAAVESERRKKEEMERSAKLNEIAERQRKREEELEERGRLIAAVEFERRKKEEMERSARLNEIAERQRKREEEPEERGRLIAAVESERRKKEEMERSAKLNEIAERQRKREEELEERGRLIAAVESERRKKEEMERSAKLNEIAERQRKREEELEERGRLIAAVEFERRKKEEMERSARLNEIAERQRKREEEPEERGRLIAAVESERRKKEEMERSAKLNEIAERQRKREEELEERGRLIAAVEFERRKKEEMERSAKLNEIAERQRKREEEPEERGRLTAAVESERRKKEEMERSAKLNEIAERQRKREVELEERERLRKEAILGRGTPIDKPLSDLPVPGSTAPAAAASDKYVPRFRRSAAPAPAAAASVKYVPRYRRSVEVRQQASGTII